jgi:polyisoprenoid-binding protein YceI
MKKLLAGLVLLVLPMVTFAAVPSWKIMPEASSINFTATQNDAPVKGSFQTFTGDIQGDPADLKNSRIKIIVDIASVKTSYGEIATTLKAADWFDIAHFPKAVFTASNFTQTGKNTYLANGKLTIRDKTVPVTLNFVLEEYSAADLEVKGSTTLRRTLFGVGSGGWSKTDSIKDDVLVEFMLKASKA